MTRGFYLWLGAALLLACSDPSEPSTPTLAAVDIDAPRLLVEVLGDTVRFSAIARDRTGGRLGGKVFSWQSSNTSVATVDANGVVTAVSNGVTGITALADGIASGTKELTVDANTWSAISVAEDATCAVTRSGAAYCWGDNNRGQLAQPSPLYDSDLPLPVGGGLAFKSVAGGEDYFCGLNTAGAAYCWGYNRYGQLGDGTTTSPRYEPIKVRSLDVFKEITTGLIHTCALTTQGIALCWGDNRWGQLGNGSTASSSEPIAVSTQLRFRQISAGGSHTCALTETGGQIWCWGFGLLGNGDTQPSTTPVRVTGERFYDRVSAGAIHTCALSDDHAYCWGANHTGQLGVPPTSCGHDFLEACSTVPVQSGLQSPIHTIAAGYTRTCASPMSNELYCWGVSADYLGGPTTDGSAPVRIAAPGFSALAIGPGHICGLTFANIAYCWGDGGFGQLGNGSKATQVVPTMIAERRR